MTIDQLGGASGSGLMEQTLAGKALADDGNIYDTVQAAENAASSLVVVGPGTFNEAVAIDTPGLRLVGSGYGTLIDGGTTGSAIEINAANVSVENLSLQTTSGAGNSYWALRAIAGSDNTVVKNVTVRNSDLDGIAVSSDPNALVTNCRIEAAEQAGIVPGTSTIVSNCIIAGTTAEGIDINFEDDVIVVNCTIFNPGTDGIIIASGNDNLVGGNRIHGAGDNGIEISGTDNLIFNNRISGSASNDISDSGTTTTTDANLTGAAN